MIILFSIILELTNNMQTGAPDRTRSVPPEIKEGNTTTDSPAKVTTTISPPPSGLTSNKPSKEKFGLINRSFFPKNSSGKVLDFKNEGIHHNKTEFNNKKFLNVNSVSRGHRIPNSNEINMNSLSARKDQEVNQVQITNETSAKKTAKKEMSHLIKDVNPQLVFEMNSKIENLFQKKTSLKSEPQDISGNKNYQNLSSITNKGQKFEYFKIEEKKTSYLQRNATMDGSLKSKGDGNGDADRIDENQRTPSLSSSTSHEIPVFKKNRINTDEFEEAAGEKFLEPDQIDIKLNTAPPKVLQANLASDNTNKISLIRRQQTDDKSGDPNDAILEDNTGPEKKITSRDARKVEQESTQDKNDDSLWDPSRVKGKTTSKERRENNNDEKVNSEDEEQNSGQKTETNQVESNKKPNESPSNGTTIKASNGKQDDKNESCCCEIF